jgi:probable 2-oxoglutarate dehydrogenase E1 component DHKTD1
MFVSLARMSGGGLFHNGWRKFPTPQRLLSCLLFFHVRHAMFVDQQDESVVVPLNTELNSKGRLELANSKSAHSTGSSCSLVQSIGTGSLSEFAILAVSLIQNTVFFFILLRVALLMEQFEYGVSWERPSLLPIWEAQVRLIVFGIS